MIRSILILLVCLPVLADSLNYTISYASGLSLCEASPESSQSNGGSKDWTFDADIDVSVPGFPVRDKYHSTATTSLCSTRLDKTMSRGPRKTEERVTFDQEKQIITRETLRGGGKSEVAVP